MLRVLLAPGQLSGSTLPRGTPLGFLTQAGSSQLWVHLTVFRFQDVSIAVGYVSHVELNGGKHVIIESPPGAFYVLLWPLGRKRAETRGEPSRILRK